MDVKTCCHFCDSGVGSGTQCVFISHRKTFIDNSATDFVCRMRELGDL